MSDKDDKKVIIYSTSWCAFCHTEAQWLEHLGIPHEIRNIEENDKYRDELLEKLGGNFSGVPVSDIGGTMVLGFDRPKLMDAMKAIGLEPQKA